MKRKLIKLKGVKLFILFFFSYLTRTRGERTGEIVLSMNTLPAVFTTGSLPAVSRPYFNTAVKVLSKVGFYSRIRIISTLQAVSHLRYFDEP
jgi:hypothetical protein